VVITFDFLGLGKKSLVFVQTLSKEVGVQR